MNIIGKATTIDLHCTHSDGKKEVVKGGEYNIIAIGKFENGGKAYITDKELKPGQHLILVQDLIKEYKPVSNQ